jgi:hypothetical protein
MKKAFLAILVLAGAGCGNRPFVVVNDCGGSWVQVLDGRGRVLAERIDFGRNATVDLGGLAGQRVELVAQGYDLVTNKPLGSVTTDRYIPTTGGMFTGPDQIQPWQVNYLPGGCRR